MQRQEPPDAKPTLNRSLAHGQGNGALSIDENLSSPVTTQTNPDSLQQVSPEEIAAPTRKSSDEEFYEARESLEGPLKGSPSQGSFQSTQSQIP